jgi:radical SAM superfamily enzyme YgiQ (UPF0313 family)
MLKLTGADFGVLGEGEVILYQLIQALKNKKDYSKIRGLVIRQRENVIINCNGKYIKNIRPI